MEATLCNPFFVIVFKSLRCHLSTIETGRFQKNPLLKPFSKVSVFISVIWRFSVDNGRKHIKTHPFQFTRKQIKDSCNDPRQCVVILLLVHKITRKLGCKVHNKASTETLSYLQWLGPTHDPWTHPSQIAERTTEEHELLTTQKTLVVLLERLRKDGTRWEDKARDNGACGGERGRKEGKIVEFFLK